MSHPRHHARTDPDRPAYVMAGSGETLSYGALERAANRGAHALRGLGIGQGGTVAMVMENRLALLELAWAAQRAGVFYTAISTHLTAPEIAYIARDSGARALVLSDPFAPLEAEIAAACPGLRVMTLEAWAALCAEAPETSIADEAAGADLLYSSGTTGRPKGIERSFSPQPIETVIPSIMTLLCAERGEMDARAVYLSPAPLYHAAPLRFCMMTAMLGGTAVIMERFDAEQMLALIARHRVTHTQVVPTMFVRLLRLPQAVRARADLSSLRLVWHAAAPCPVGIKRAMIDWWGPILTEYYAGTEANGITLAGCADWLARPGTVGRALTGRIVIADAKGRELGPHETGTVHFDSGIAFAYRGDPAKTAAAHLRPGCATLGDIGHIDEEGWLFLTDRAAHMIISGGVNIYPQEAEDRLICHPDVADVAVIGIPDAEMGEAVHALVRLEPGLAPSPERAAALLAWCREGLGAIKCPRSLNFRETLPRSPTGKLMKRALRDEFWPAAPARATPPINEPKGQQ